MKEQSLLLIIAGWAALAIIWLLVIRKKEYVYYLVGIWKSEIVESDEYPWTKVYAKNRRLRLCPDGTWQVLMRQWVFSPLAHFLFPEAGLVQRYAWLSLKDPADINAAQESIVSGELKFK